MTQPVTYKYGADFQMKILAMIARDTGFVRQYHTILDPLHFQYAPMQILAQIILDNFKSFGVLISSTTAEAKVDEYIMHYRLDDGSSSPYASSALGNLRHWLDDDTEISDLIEKLPEIRREDICKK